MATKNPTSWVPQPLGYGYVVTQTSVNLQTASLKNVETAALLPLETAAYKVTGKNATVWTGTGS